MKKVLVLVFLLYILSAVVPAQTASWQLRCENPEYLHRAVKEVTDVIVHDIYSPPVASRIYAYVTIAAYEAAHHANEKYTTLSGQLHGLTQLPKPDKNNELSYNLASVNAGLLVARSLIISEEKLVVFQSAILQEFKSSGMPPDIYDSSISYSKKVAAHIIAWAATDQYKETRSLSKYPVGNDPSSWKPTPPAYIKAIEPHWSKLRTFILDSAQQFKPPAPTAFSIDTNSRFFKEAKDVMSTGLSLNAEQIEIANFWDCNPFKMNVNGHVMYATKKISPGGHWINITALACKKAKAGFLESAEAYACLSIILADGFISCWDEKFRSKVVRPETYINQYMNVGWMPLLQTPPFPEYTSGHSVISAACSVMLTNMFGDNFAYSDSTEMEFKLPVRQYKSFADAAKEAAISRFYGGIHYMPSITNGLMEGEKLGNFITQKLRIKK